jgi:hypothetical protein
LGGREREGEGHAVGGAVSMLSPFVPVC